MLKDKKEILAVVFSIFILVLVGIITYAFLNSDEEKTTIPQVKTRAAGETYRKEIALNTTQSAFESTPTEESTPTPTQEIIPSEEPSPTLLAFEQEEESFNDEFLELSPTPTDVVMAKISPTNEVQQEDNLSPTKIESLPKSGYFYYNIFLFAVGIFVIMLSLVI